MIHTDDPEVGKTYVYTEDGYVARVKVTAIHDDPKQEWRDIRVQVIERIRWPAAARDTEFNVGYWYGGEHANPYRFAGGRFEPA